DIKVQSIPVEFYGSANPVIKFKNIEKEIMMNKGVIASESEKALFEKSSAAGAGKPMHPANIFSNRKFLIFSAVGVFALFIVGTSVYYWRQETAKKQTAAIPAAPATQTTVEPTTTEELAEQPAVEQPEAKEEIETIVEEAPIIFPSLLLGDSPDLDGDDLSDTAEESFGLDSALADTDKDNFQDGHEIYNLYNPAGFEPMKIADSGLIREFTNPVWGYAIYYPSSWDLGNVDENYKQVLFSALSGENIEARVFEKDASESFADWFAKWAPNERFDELKSFTSVFKVDGFRRDDYLVYYFPTETKVFVIIYNTTDSNEVNYRIVAKMMARSFSLLGGQAENISAIQTEQVGAENSTSSQQQ
ncbi:MAG: hypothetical protein PHY40_04480, partial [Patescibacteria group bacterium]|nr:hypothetical protein [Patescibacteria group bacterium]